MSMLSSMTTAERRAIELRYRAEAEAEAANQQAQRRRLAEKIVLVLTDRIVNDVVRPGPVPEERECYEMAEEVRALRGELIELATHVINVEKASHE